MAQESKPIRVGVVGVGRGQTFMAQAHAAGMELVAICDTWQQKLEEVGATLGVAIYTDYDAFLCLATPFVTTSNPI